MFRTVPLSTIRSFSLYTQQWYMSYRFADSLRAGSGWNQFHPDPVRKLSANLYDIYHCCMYSDKILMMDRIYHDARSPERQILSQNLPEHTEETHEKCQGSQYPGQNWN